MFFNSRIGPELPGNLDHECVGAIIVRGKSILLGKRTAQREFYANVWDVFGGHVEPGESPERTLRRELEEELGILPTAWRYLETLRDLDPTRRAVFACHFYVVTEWSGIPKNVEPQEHADINWYCIEDAAQLNLAHSGYVRIFQTAIGASDN